MPKFDHRISARHALTAQEMSFCRIYVAMRKRHGSKIEAYRRAFWPQVKDKQTGALVDNPDMPDQRTLEKRVAGLLGQQHILDYIAELEEAPEDRARATIYEQVQLSDDKEAAKAAGMILAMEDKVGFETDAERWAEIMCAIGAEVVVPLPNGGETIFPLGHMFPQWAGATPPDDAIVKTIRSLEALRVTLKEREADGREEEDVQVSHGQEGTAPGDGSVEGLRSLRRLHQEG